MISIYDLPYTRNIERTRAPATRSDGPKGAPRDFHKVIEDLAGQNDASPGQGAKASDVRKLGHAPEPRIGLSSRESDESSKSPSGLFEPRRDMRARLSPDFLPLPEVRKVPKDVKNEGPKGVNKSPRNVNMATPLMAPNGVRPLSAKNEATKLSEAVSAYRVQARSAGFPGAGRSSKNDLGKGELREMIRSTARIQGVDPDLGLAIAQAESNVDPLSVSTDGHGSKGIFQLLDSTGRDMMSLSGLAEDDYDPFDASLNSLLGTRYLRRLFDIFSVPTRVRDDLTTVSAGSADDLEKLAVAAFNAGEGSVAEAQSKARQLGKDPSLFNSVKPHLPVITQGYVERVSNLKAKMAADRMS